MTNTHHKGLPSDYIVINTDGSCLGNPGPGGWAVSIERYVGGECIKQCLLNGNAELTTNNRMELKAALSGLTKLRKHEEALIILRSDSRYLIDGMTKWRKGWEKRCWRKSDGTAVANEDLWRRLSAAECGKRVRWEWVRGHSGDPANEKVDRIAREQAQRAKK